MNVLHIRDTGDMLGAESVILELVKHSTEFGVNAHIGVLGGGSDMLVKVASNIGLSAFIIPCAGKVDIKTIKYLRKYIQDNSIDIVHAHGYKEDFYALFSKETPLIATNHLWKKTTAALKLYAYIDSKLLKKFNAVVAVSKPILEDMKNAKLPPNKLHLIANGVDMERFKNIRTDKENNYLKNELGIPLDRPIIGMISSLSKEKGHAGALNSFAKILRTQKKCHMLIVGAGEEETALLQQVDELAITENVTFTGRRDDIPEIHSIIDIFLLNSLIEGLPMALLEAMASAKAVIATNVGDVASAVIDNQTGILIESNNEKALTAALETLLTNKSKIEQLGRSARQQIVDNFSSVSMTENYIKLYRDLIV